MHACVARGIEIVHGAAFQLECTMNTMMQLLKNERIFKSCGGVMKRNWLVLQRKNVLNRCFDSSMDFRRSFSTEENVHNDNNVPFVEFRMPDLSLEDLHASTVMRKWYVQEGAKINKNETLCEIETPDLLFDLQSEDEGYLAKILVAEGVVSIKAGKALGIIVKEQEDIDRFKAVKDTPSSKPEAGGNVMLNEKESSESHPHGANVLRLINRLSKDGDIVDPEVLKALKSLARRGDKSLMNAYEGSFGGTDFDDASFDKAFFLENIQELVEEHMSAEKTNKL